MPSASHRDLFRRDTKAQVARRWDLDRWRQFVRHICKDLEVKRELSSRQDGVCAFCDRPIVGRLQDDAVVHHLSYDHECTLMRSNVLKPKCGDCLQSHEQTASACLELLRLLHRDCHETLHRVERRDRAWKMSVGHIPRDEDRIT